MTSPLERRLRRLSEEPRRTGVDAPPERVYALFEDELSAPAMYLEAGLTEHDPPVPVIVHNFRYYRNGMRRWDAGFVELLVLNELHELTHWAMTDDERERLASKSRRHGRPDGDWLNPPLFGLIEWLPVDGPDVVDLPPSTWERLVAILRRHLPWVRGTGGDGGEEPGQLFGE